MDKKGLHTLHVQPRLKTAINDRQMRECNDAPIIIISYNIGCMWSNHRTTIKFNYTSMGAMALSRKNSNFQTCASLRTDCLSKR